MITDPTLWGVQPNGFYAPTVDEVQARLSTDLLSYVDADLDLDADAAEGQMVGVYARQAALFWQGLKVVHDSNNPDNAEADLLDDLCKLSGTTRLGPQPTRVSATVVLTAGTTLQTGVTHAAPNGHPEIAFTPVADFTAPSDGTYTMLWVCTETGPIVLAANTLQVRLTSESGWTSITNSSPGITGTNGDDDAATRLKREADLAKTGTATDLALEADIEALTGVNSVNVLSNVTDYTDGNGLPPHSVAAYVYGVPSSIDLAKAIFEGKPSGIPTYGTNTITYVDTKGRTQTVRYTPVLGVDIHLTFEITVGTDYVGDDIFKATVVQLANEKAKVGNNVLALPTHALAMQVGGVIDSPSLQLWKTGGSPGIANITIGQTEAPVFSVGNVTVTHV